MIYVFPIFLALVYALIVVTTFRHVGKPRKPLTRADAVAASLAWLPLFVGLVFLVLGA